jgi:hypothetical protein
VEREREVTFNARSAHTGARDPSLLVEGGVLAFVGGAAGFLASLWGVDLLLRLVPERLPRAADIGIDRRVFLFALVTSLVAGLLVGLAPHCSPPARTSSNG